MSLFMDLSNRPRVGMVLFVVERLHCKQECLRVGAQCWVLHPSNGTKPVAEGIAGPALYPPMSPEESIISSLLRRLCEDAQQQVKVTKMHKKNTELMFPDVDKFSKFLDDYVNPEAPRSPFVTWNTQYLVEKVDDA